MLFSFVLVCMIHPFSAWNATRLFKNKLIAWNATRLFKQINCLERYASFVRPLAVGKFVFCKTACGRE